MSIGLRPFEAADRTSLLVLFGEPGTRQWNPGPDDADVDAWSVQANDGGSSSDFRTWAIADAEDGRLLGNAAPRAVQARAATVTPTTRRTGAGDVDQDEGQGAGAVAGGAP